MNWYWVYSHWLVTYAEKQDTRRKNANKKRTIQTSICKLFHRGANGNEINKLVNECDIVSTNFVHIFIVGPFKFISIGGRMDGGNWRWEEQPRVVFYFLSQVWLCVIFFGAMDRMAPIPTHIRMNENVYAKCEAVRLQYDKCRLYMHKMFIFSFSTRNGKITRD